MSQIIRAIYENGVFRPLERPNLTEHEQVRLTVEPASDAEASPGNGESDPLDGVRVATGIADLAKNFDDFRFGKRTP